MPSLPPFAKQSPPLPPFAKGGDGGICFSSRIGLCVNPNGIEISPGYEGKRSFRE
jgi:hypothetical protein